MKLTPTLSSPGDVMAKLAREHARAINSHEITDIADHLYNFSITSLAVRDHIFEHLLITDQNEKSKKFQSWNPTKTIKAAHDIGNSCKHFCLRDPRTQKEKPTTADKIETSPTQIKYVTADSNGKQIITWVDSIKFTEVS